MGITVVAVPLAIYGLLYWWMSCPAGAVGYKCEEGVVLVANVSDEAVTYIVNVEGKQVQRVGPYLPRREHVINVGTDGCLAAPVKVTDEAGELLGELEAACAGTRLTWEGQGGSG